MKETGRVIRIISMKEDREFQTNGEVKDWLNRTCRVLRNGKYHFYDKRYLGEEKNPPGTILIFKWKNNLIGEGIIKEDRLLNKDKTIPEPYYVKFEPTSIRTYTKEIPVPYIRDMIKELTGKDIQGQGTTIINGQAYLHILSKIMENGFGFT